MDGRVIAADMRDPIGKLGGGFMASREAKAYVAETGFTGWTPYFRGRCGVLGDVDADVVAAVAGFFDPELVRRVWTDGQSLPAAQGARRYAQVCQEWGRRKLTGLADADRLAELLERVAGNASAVGAPLFAGWRAMPLPDDGLARVAQLAHVLRELRGGLHLVAVVATGLSPLEAVLTGPDSLIVAGGVTNASYFGWSEPYPEMTDEVRRQRAQAEELTNTLIAPAFGILTDAEAGELTGLLAKACEIAFG